MPEMIGSTPVNRMEHVITESGSGHDAGYDLPGDVRKTISAAKMFVGQFLMVNTHQMFNGCMKIMDADWIFDDIVTELVRFAINYSGLNTPACHPDAEALRMMVPAIVVFT